MTLAEEYKIGLEIKHPTDEKQRWRVVRIVERDTALVVNDQGKEFITTESYVMLKSERGEIDFVLLLSESTSSAVSTPGQITPLPTLWRKHHGSNT